uniref:Annexin n=1 Tax=Pseudonaja textilis TaxID=8673 RepID=A0A670ZTC3_PSETE
TPSLWYRRPVGSRGTIQDFAGFNASKDAEALKTAMEGLGTDETTVIEILTGRSNAQRQLIAEEFKSYTGKELKDALKEDTSGDFGRALVALVTPPAEFDAEQINRTVRGVGTNETALIEIVASRNSQQIRDISQVYYRARSSMPRHLPCGGSIGNPLEQEPTWLPAHFFCLFTASTEQEAKQCVCATTMW